MYNAQNTNKKSLLVIRQMQYTLNQIFTMVRILNAAGNILLQDSPLRNNRNKINIPKDTMFI